LVATGGKPAAKLWRKRIDALEGFRGKRGVAAYGRHAARPGHRRNGE
jgi:hypothetical protein